MSAIVAPEGSPLAFAVLSCERLESTLAFYRDRIGFTGSEIARWEGAVLERLFGTGAGPAARVCLLRASPDPVGAIVLLEFEVARRERIRPRDVARAYGLVNLNFYTRDARAAAASFATLGFELWSDPTMHSFTGAVGAPVEVIFDGPDGVAINLVELTSEDPATRIGQMRAYVERHGRTRTGFTPVVTTSHVCRSIARARAFYEQALGMGVLIDEELASDAANGFLRLPPGSRTHVVFMQGAHMFGKIALSEPLNYACEDLTPRAHAPNLGYLAQAFEVEDLATACAGARASGAPIVLEPGRDELPLLGRRRHALLRNPGSGALQWLLERA